MAAPLLWVVLAAGALFVALKETPKKPEPVTPPGPGPGPGPKNDKEIPPGGVTDHVECFDDSMPPAIRTQVLNLLDQVTDTALLDQAAATLALGGFAKAAACVKARAEKLKGGKPVPGYKPVPDKPVPDLPETPGMPFVIRFNDSPYLLAAYYTGQGTRLGELGAVNPQLGKLVTVNNVTGYEVWVPGLPIVIPGEWDPYERPWPIAGTTTPSNYQPKLPVPSW